jgi:putative holliday junction resolvase
VRLAGVDFGGRWFGIALSDPTGTIASPLETADGEAAAVARLGRLIAEEGVGLIVVGLPRNMDGSIGPKAREALGFAERLRERLGAPVETWDERLTTVQAERYLRDSGTKGRRRSDRVNQVAAQILLQSYLDWKRAAPPPPEEEAGDGDEDEGPEGDGGGAEN